MKKMLLLMGLICLPILSTAQVTNYTVGDIVDDFTVTDVEGNEHNLYSITATGKYVFLDFFFVNCGPCQTWQPTYNELYDKYGCNQGEIYCLSINSGIDDDAAVIAYEETFGGPFNHAPAVSMEGGSGAVDDNFGVIAYPTFCLINPDNEIINTDIWPLTGVETFEAAFPEGFDPAPMECTILGIGDTNTLSVTLYPNPVSANGNLTIRLDAPQTSQVTIFSVTGRSLYSHQFEGSEIEIPVNLASGTYFLSIDGENGSVKKSFIVQ